jgi:hypothetical protein
VGIGVLLLIIGVLAGVLLVGRDDNKAATTTTAPATDVSTENVVSLEPVNHTGPNPFLPPVGKDHTGVKPPPNTAGTFPADTPGLYGGTMHQGSCDPQKLVTFLKQNPDKASAWAKTLGISVSDIPDYVSGLTPVILRTATSVTNHGYVNGQANAIPAVLEPGTAVLVDKYGQPVTKCYCGNPLTAPTTYSSTKYVGPTWSGWSPRNITIIQNTTVVIQQFTLVDIETNQVFTRPAGTTGTDDTPDNTDTSGSSDTEPATSSTTEPSTSPRTSPTSEATTAPTTQAGPSPQDKAKAKLQAAASACYPFPAPIEDSTSQSVNTIGDGPTFTLEVVDQTVSGGTQTFDWSVDAATGAFTPQNDLATVASNHCPGLN